MSLRFLHLHGNTFVLYSLYMELLGGAFGGGDAGGGTLYTRRGFEKVLFYATIAGGVLFIAVNLAALFLLK